MIRFTRDQLDELQKVRQFPCVTFYLPILKEGSDIRQGPIRLKKMVKATEDALREKGMRTPLIDRMTGPVRELYDDALFWSHQEASLALFFNESGLKTVKLPIDTEESVTIADRFAIRPLLPLMGQDGHYHMLWLELSDTRLYRCTRYDMIEVKLSGLPVSLKSVVDSYSDEKQLQHHSGNSKGRRTASNTGGSVYSSSESARDNEKGRIEEYFRQIDSSLRKVLDRKSVV